MFPSRNNRPSVTCFRVANGTADHREEPIGLPDAMRPALRGPSVSPNGRLHVATAPASSAASPSGVDKTSKSFHGHASLFMDRFPILRAAGCKLFMTAARYAAPKAREPRERKLIPACYGGGRGSPGLGRHRYPPMDGHSTAGRRSDMTSRQRQAHRLLRPIVRRRRFRGVHFRPPTGCGESWLRSRPELLR